MCPVKNESPQIYAIYAHMQFEARRCFYVMLPEEEIQFCDKNRSEVDILERHFTKNLSNI